MYDIYSCFTQLSVEGGSIIKKPPAEDSFPHEPANTKDDKGTQEKAQENEEQNKRAPVPENVTNISDQEGKDWFDIYMTLIY